MSAEVSRAVEVRNTEAHDCGVDSGSCEVVQVGSDAGDVEAARVEELRVGRVVGDGGECGVKPGGCGEIGGSGDEEVAREGAAAVERTCQAGVDDFRAGVLSAGGGGAGACGCNGTNESGGLGAGRAAAEYGTDGVGGGPGGAVRGGAAPDAASSGEKVGGEGRVEESGSVKESCVVGDLRSANGGWRVEVGGGAENTEGARGEIDARADGYVPVGWSGGVDEGKAAFARGELGPRGEDGSG